MNATLGREDIATKEGLRRIQRLALLVVALWTMVLGASLGWNVSFERERALDLAAGTLRAAFFKDLAIRLWATKKGGVYVDVDDENWPIPYLAHLPDRDIRTKDGRELTLLDPATMLRQIMDEYSTLYGIQGRITAPVSLNPANLPDAWEARAIDAFRNGSKEVSEIVQIEGKPHLKLMRPMAMAAGCLKCHAHQGAKFGDIWGGVGVSMALEPYYAESRQGIRALSATHGGFWFVGLLGIGVIGRRARQRFLERQRTLDELLLAAHVFEDSLQGIMVTDVAGRILRVNKTFTVVTGYDEAEAIGQTPRILKSGRHDHDFYRQFWEQLKTAGSWQGEIWNRRKNGEGYPSWESIFALRDVRGEIRYFVSISQDITSQKDASERIHRLAHYDVLTGLPNRVLFEERLRHALGRCHRLQGRLALLFVDIDHFKKINDTYGHSAGDRLLEVVAERMVAALRDTDTLARLGGDEFTVLVEDVADAGDLEPVARKLIEVLARPVAIRETEVFVSASIGIALSPDDGADYESLLRNADTAMYQAKAAGRNRWQLYRQEMSDQVANRLELDTALRYALARGEFILYYQPRARTADQRMVGCEALIRWRHPVRGLVPPDEFIPLAEETGLIVEIGAWVLTEACRQMADWCQRWGGACRVSVNVSAQQMRRTDFVGQVRAALSEAGLNPSCLELEITETSLMDNIEPAIAAFRELSALGVAVSIDDFGTGYSSLSYLKRLPIQCLKIDRSFVRDTPADRDDCAIVKTIIAMSETLHIHVVAEGVETAEQLDFLAREGCPEFQGYLLAKPLPPDEFERRVATGELAPACGGHDGPAC